MKYIIAGLLLTIWMILTLILTISILGWIIVLENSGWREFPNKLLEVFKT